MSALLVTAVCAGVVAIIVAVTMYRERHRIRTLRCGRLAVSFDPADTIHPEFGGEPGPRAVPLGPSRR